MNSREERIEIANQIIHTFCPIFNLYQGKYKLRMKWGWFNGEEERIFDYPADLRHDGSEVQN